jgi:tyrosyl-tRNA synthetase
LELCTTITDGEIAGLKTKLEQGMNPRDAKLILAEEVVKMYHGVKAATLSHENFLKSFGKARSIPNNIPETLVQRGAALSDALQKANVISSKSEFHRLISEGAISIIGSNQKISDAHTTVSENMDLRVGKHRFVRIRTIS